MEGLGMKNVGIFEDHLEYTMTNWYNMWSFGTFVVIWFILPSFGTFCGHLVYFVVIWYIPPVLVCCSKKNLATLVGGL
jgi:hypothetical protein